MTITIRQIEPDDYAAIQKIFSGPRTVWGISQPPYPSVEAWRKKLAEPPAGVYSLVACVADEVVGQIGLHTALDRPRRRHAGQIGIAVREDWHGKGVGTALMQAVVDLADNWINLSRLELEVYTDNVPAIKLYQKFGFVIEGTGHNYNFRDGEYVDVYFMARLRAQKG